MPNPIRPEDLPAVPDLGATDALIVDTGTGVYKTTPEEIVAAGGALTAAALSGPGGSNDVGFLQAGTGAVTRTIQAKNREIISTTDFGTPQQAATYAETVDADVYLPAGDVVGNVTTDSDAIFEGSGRLFDTSSVQRSTYAEPRSRFVIGQEYLWAFHQAVIGSPAGTLLDIVFNGDSTTYGSFNGGTLPEAHRIHNLNDAQLKRYGIYGPVSHNSGTNGKTTREWIGAAGSTTHKLSEDITDYPNMILYILRLGLNDGAAGAGYHDIEQYREDIRAGLTTIRAWKGVDELSVILMTPASASETGFRDEAWLEQVARVLKRAARDFNCTFIDTYALWRDSRAGINNWLDDDGQGGSGIHPDGTFNHWIADEIGRVAYAPLAVNNVATNTFINASGVATRSITASAAPESFVRGVSIFRTDNPATFPIDGILRVTRSADGVVMQENIGFATTAEGAGKRTYTRYALDGYAWSAWRGLRYTLTLGSGWSTFGVNNLDILYRKLVDGTVMINGRVKNAAATLGSSLGQLPAGFHPPVNMRFIVHNAGATTVGTIEIQTDGNIAWVSGDNTDVVINLSFQAAD